MTPPSSRSSDARPETDPSAARDERVLADKARLPGFNAALDDAIRTLLRRVEAAGEGGPDRIQRFEIVFDGADPLAFLAAQAPGRRSYFRTRDGVTAVASIGTAASFTHPDDPAFAALREREPAATALLAGRFDAEREHGPEWRAFGRHQVLVPAVVLRRDADRTSLAAVVVGDARPTLAALARLRGHELAVDPHDVVPEYAPGFGADVGVDSSESAWNDAVQATLAAIERADVRKIVLARTRTFRLSAPADPCALLGRLGDSEPGTYQFLLEPQPGVAFVGASPERLFRRSGRSFESEAVAGTRPRGETPDADTAQAQALFDSEKDRREHRLVLDRIRERLESVARSLQIGRAPRLLRLARVQHLSTPVEAVLKDDVSDGELLARLHPTPAVCGQPAEKARAVIRSCEPFDRGLYAGPIGLLGATTDVCVAIRSALVVGSSVTAFAGAGIVAGSDAQLEWRETEHKLATIERLVRPA
jgi:menaquinone-specific isochorismate synthase